MIPLFFDTETTGLIVPGKDPTDPAQPMPVQLGMKLDAADRMERGALNFMLKTDGWQVNPQAAAITGIDNKVADAFGVDFCAGMEMFLDYMDIADVAIAHNARFDVTVMRRSTAYYCEKVGIEYFDPFENTQVVCTMLASMNIVKAKPKRNGQWKWPKLEECVKHFFGRNMVGAHDALNDVKETANVFYHLMDTGVFDEEPEPTRNLR